MTTRTQWVRKVTDSHRNRSILQRLSFICPGTLARTDQWRPLPASSDGRESFAHVFVDCNIEGQGDLFSDSRTAPAGIPLLHFDDRVMSSALGPFGPGLGRRFGENSMRYFCLHTAW